MIIEINLRGRIIIKFYKWKVKVRYVLTNLAVYNGELCSFVRLFVASNTVGCKIYIQFGEWAGFGF